MSSRSVLLSTKNIFCLVLTLSILMATGQRQFGTYAKKDIDFDVYFFTAQIVHDNPAGDLYFSAFDGNPQLRDAPPDSPIFRKAEQGGVHAIQLYLYPPLLADLLVPLARFSPERAANIWRGCDLLLLLIAIAAMARVQGADLFSPRFLVIAAGCYCFFPVVESLRLGQVTLLLLALWAVGVYAYGRGLYVVSAIAMVVATVLKVTPLLILPLFFLWKDRRWLIAYMVGLISVVLGLGLFNGWHTLAASARVIAAMGGSVPRFQNKCISALFAWVYYGRVFEEDTFPVFPRALALVSKVASLAFYASCVYLAWRSRRALSVRHRVTIFAVFALVSLLTSPVSWRHGYAVALVPLSLLWWQALGEARPSRRTFLLAVSSLSVGTILFDLAAGMHRLPQPIRIVFAGVSVVSCVLLCLDVLARGVDRLSDELSVIPLVDMVPVEDTPVVVLVQRNDAGGAEAVLRGAAGGGAHLL